MIFEEKQFNEYCFGQKYENTVNVHLTGFETFVFTYQKASGRSIQETQDWLRNQRILEAGCAMGHVMDDLIKNGVKYCCGYEPSRYANDHQLSYLAKDGRIIEGDHDKVLPLISDNSYDIVFANSLQYSFNEDDIFRWIKEIYRICNHSLLFVGITTQGLYRSVSGKEIWNMQIIKPTNWWSEKFTTSGFKRLEWMNDIICVCMK